MITIPLSSGDVIEVDTTINDDSYRFTTKWNDRFESYTLDVTRNGEDAVNGIKLVFGTDIFQAYNEIPINRVYVINKIGSNLPLEYDGLDSDKGFVVIIEDSDLEV